MTFEEVPLSSANPVYTVPSGGGPVTVSFAGLFAGQSVIGNVVSDATPTGPLGLGGGPRTFVTVDGANPTGRVLSGSPIFSGPIAVLFNTDVAGVKFDAGFFDFAGSIDIAAFDRLGNTLATFNNAGDGIETFGIHDDQGLAVIAGLSLSVRSGPFDAFAFDQLTFGGSGVVTGVPGEPTDVVPLPAGLALLGTAMTVLGMTRRRRHA